MLPRVSVILTVYKRTKHLAVADTRKLGIEVVKAGKFLDDLFGAAPQRVRHAIRKSLRDLSNPPYSIEEMISALRLHGAKATAMGMGNKLPDE